MAGGDCHALFQESSKHWLLALQARSVARSKMHRWHF